jgi:tetratricopeptide (TPR) repeat protein
LRVSRRQYLRSGLINVAIIAYKAAAALAPEDPLPLSNLSAACFEAGLYAECIEAAEDALRLTNIEQQILQQKLSIRLSYAFLQRQESNKVPPLLLKIPDTYPDKKAIEKCLGLTQTQEEREKSATATAILSSLLGEVAQYKPALYAARPFPFGCI